MRTCVYYIKDAEGRIMYVGMTCNPKRRWDNHISASRRPTTKVARWVAEEIAAGRMPTMRVAKWFDNRLDARMWEMRRIREVTWKGAWKAGHKMSVNTLS